MQTSMLIGGALAAGENSPEAVLNPRTGETIAEVPEASEAQVDAAVAAARGAFDDLVADHARSSAPPRSTASPTASRPRPTPSPPSSRSTAASRSTP